MKPSLVISWGFTALVAVGLGLAFFLIPSPTPQVAWALSTVWRLVILTLFFLGSIQLVWLSQKLGRLQPATGPWLFLGVLGCGLIGFRLLAQEQQFQHDKAVLEEVQATRAALQEQVRARAQDVLAESERRRARLQEDRYVRYEDQVDSLLLDELRTLDAAQRARFTEVETAFARQLAETDLSGPETWLRSTDPATLTTAREAHFALGAAAFASVEVLQGFEDDYEAAIEAQDFPPALRRIALAEMERLTQDDSYDTVLTMRTLDVELMSLAVQALQILEDEWGRWEAPEDGPIRFENERLASEFYFLLGEIQAAAQRQQALIEEAN